MLIQHISTDCLTLASFVQHEKDRTKWEVWLCGAEAALTSMIDSNKNARFVLINIFNFTLATRHRFITLPCESLIRQASLFIVSW